MSQSPFYDDCRFNEDGARLVAAALAEQVKTRKLKRGSGSPPPAGL
jgi:hypothetical protein